MKLILLHENAAHVIKTFHDSRRGYKVYLVDGQSVRDLSNTSEEFGGLAVHPQFPDLIPEDEIWIEQTSSEDEIPILVDTALYLLMQIDAGKKMDDAYAAAMRREKGERTSLELSKHKHKKYKYALPDEIYVRLYKTLRDGTKVWIVNGEEVRNHTKIDFIEGGHSAVYNFIPDGEIWLEGGLNKQELPYILYHELVERRLMRRGMGYNNAHRIAADKEYDKRKARSVRI